MKPRLMLLCRVGVFLFAALAGLASATNASAMPVIENLDVRASITEKGILSVEETVEVLFNGEPLSQDLTRGISGHYAKSGREKNKTGFVLLNATLDGQPAKTAIRRNPESLRLTLAGKGERFEPGLRVFKLKYELINMIVFHPEQDTLIWRLLRESSCVVNRVAVDISLPGKIDSGGEPARRNFKLFSGQLDDMREGKGIRANPSGLLTTVLPLFEGKSFTLYLSWDKGIVTESPPALSEWRWWDAGVLAALTLYYLLVWSVFGRKPKRGAATLGTIPPEALSPGLLRYLRSAKSDFRTLEAELLNLAVKGCVHIDDFTAAEKSPSKPDGKTAAGTKIRYSSLERMMSRKYRLRLTCDPRDDVEFGSTESVLLHNLFAQQGETELVLDEKNAKRLKTAFRALDRTFAALGKRFFFQQMRWWALGLVFFEAYTAFAMFSVLSRSIGGIEPDSGHALAFMAPLFFLTPLLGGEKIWKQSTLLFIVRTCIPLFFCACALGILSQQGVDSLSLASLIGCIAVIGFFWKIAPARSGEGVALLDKIEGFQLGLGSRGELKEEDSIEKFEQLFPYACALDLERTLISRYDPLISRLRHHARWHTADTHSFHGGAEYHTLSYELGEAIKPLLRR